VRSNIRKRGGMAKCTNPTVENNGAKIFSRVNVGMAWDFEGGI
jgi:hypothetical protein